MTIKRFEDYAREGAVKKQNSDASRADFLFKSAEQRYENLQEKIDKIGVGDNNAGDLVINCYDILMELIRAKMLLGGYNSSGQGAHEAEVSYLRILGFMEKEVQFADQLRFFRNGMLYYGTILDREYAIKAIDFLKGIYPKLKKRLDKKIK
jgi:hypothetical protein